MTASISINLETMLDRLAFDVGLDGGSLYYCKRRLRAEGLQFLTITLPKLAKAVLSSLEKGYFDRPTCFAWKGRSLRHFRSLLNSVFDPRTGYVRDDPDALGLYQVRQFCEYVYKLSIDFTDDQLSDAESEFISDEENLREAKIDTEWVEKLRKDFETYYSDIATSEVKDVFRKCMPRPGNGTFAGGSRSWYLRRYYDRHPSSEWQNYQGHFKPYPSCKGYRPTAKNNTSEVSEVLFVPKDSRGPRVIVREPYRTGLSHLSFHDWITDELERHTSNRINFRDQQVNRKLAEQSSVDKKFCTIDLSKASDSVDYRIIKQLFRYCPAMRAFISTRTKQARLPSGGLLTLTKLAGMGSGLTFPLMSLLIHLTIVRAIVDNTGIPYTRAAKLVYVYGDDIIVPTHYHKIAYEAIAKVKLTPNRDKSFIYSYFRESCGGDFFHGQNVAPVRLKLSSVKLRLKSLTLQLKGSFAVVNLERHCKELVQNGMMGLSEYFYQQLEKAVGKLPDKTGESPIIGRYKVLMPKYNMDSKGNYVTLRCMVPVPVTVSKNIDPYIYLGSKLRPTSEVTWQDKIFGTTLSSTYGDVAIPRKVRYVRKHVSSFACMG